MSSVNMVIIMGRLGSDPEVRYMPNETPIATISVCTSEKWKDKKTGESKEKTQWHRVVLYRHLAEIAKKHLVKGSQVHIIGKLEHRKWKDKNTGEDKFMTEIITDTMQLVGGAPKKENRTKVVEPVYTVSDAESEFYDDIPF